jgi:autotransporter-associated beta strand protein
MKPKFRSLIAAFAPLSRSSLIVCASLCAAGSAHADRTWSGDALDGFWTSTGNWSGGVIPGTGDVAIFDATSDTNTATTLAATFSIKGLKIVDPIAAVSIAAGNTLTLDSSGIDMSTATQDLTLNSAISAGVSQSWNIASGRTLTVSGVVSGTSFTKNGAGTVLFLSTSANTIVGTVQHNAGQITVRSGTALGPATNTLALANGSIFRIETTGGGSGSGSGVFVGSPISVAASASVTQTTNSAANGYSGLITGDAASVFNVGGTVPVSYSLGSSTQQFGSFLGRVEVLDGATARFSSTSGVNNGGAAAIWDTNATGTITARNVGIVNLGSVVGTGTLSGSSGATGITTFSIGGRNEDNTFDGSITADTVNTGRVGAVTKVGSATFTLTSTTGLTYTGVTNVDAGTLKINGVKSGTGSTTVKTTTTLAGTGSIAGTTTIQSGGTLAPGSGGIGNLSFSNLTLNTGSKLNLEFGVGNDKATVSSGGTLTLQSGIIVDVNGFDTDGTYTIIDATGATVSGSASTAFTPLNNNGSKIYSFSNVGGLIKMTISTSDPSNYWNLAAGGSWATPANWTKNPVIPNAPGAIAKFGPGQGGLGGSFAGSFSATLDGDKTVGVLSFSDDFENVISIDPGVVTPGALLMDNGAAAAEIVTLLGNHIVNAPVSVDAQGLSVNTGVAINLTASSLTINGVVSGASASFVKSGAGNLFLNGNNSYGGGTILGAGRTTINSATSLGAISGPATFSGGTLQLGAALSGITRSYLVAGANSVLIDTNGFDFGYAGVISPVAGGTGGITKSGVGTMTLTGVHTYTGSTAISAGTLSLASPGSINAAGINAFAGGIFTIDGGTFSTTAASSLTNGSDIVINSGSATFAAVSTPSNTGDGCLVGVNGGTFTASSVTIHRNYNAGAALPTTVPTASGFVVTNGTASVSGGVTIGNSNSSGSALVSGGSLTVGGQFTLGNITTGGRYCTLQVTGGSFASTDATNGVVLCTQATTANSAAVLLNGGTSTVERISFGNATSAAGSIGALVLNGPSASLYMGAGGIVLTSPNAFTSTINLNQGTLGAKANWSSALAVNLTNASSGAVIIKAADAGAVARDIVLSGVLSGTGGFEKTGGGKLTLSGANAYTGTTTVSTGSLFITGDSSLATGEVVVASGATLGGSGNIGGNVTVSSGGRQEFAVAATAGAQPLRQVAGTLTLTGSLLDLTSAAPMAAGQYILATAPTIIGTPAPGNYNGIAAVVSVISGGLGQQLVIDVTASDFDTWIAGFTFAPGANVTPTGDPDGDGLTNQQEYAFGLIPNSGSSVNPITAQLDKTTGLFTYTRRKPSLTGLTYVYQYSTTLGSWTNFTPDGTTTNSGNPVEAITVDVPNTLLANDKLFVRVLAQ